MGQNYINEYLAKKDEEFVTFIKEWLKYEFDYGENLYSDAFIQAANQEIEEYPFAPCQLNCYITPWCCLEAFYHYVNSRLSEDDQFDFEKHITKEYYNEYDDVELCDYFSYWSSLRSELRSLGKTNTQIHLCGLTPYDIEKYYGAIDKQLDEYKGKVNCIKKLKIDILKECIDFRQNELDDINDPYSSSFLWKDSQDWICLEIAAIKNTIAAIEKDAMDSPLYDNDLYIINNLENWIGNLLDIDNRNSTKRFGLYTKLFLKRAFERDSWQRYLLRELGVEKSKAYFVAKQDNKHLPFSPVIEGI